MEQFSSWQAFNINLYRKEHVRKDMVQIIMKDKVIII